MVDYAGLMARPRVVPDAPAAPDALDALDGKLTVWAREIPDLDPVTEGTELRRLTGVLTENAGLDERLTARENLEYTARIRGIRIPAARRSV